eukprot:Selendium_serpulae@DN6214_c0_g1_i14.p1
MNNFLIREMPITISVAQRKATQQNDSRIESESRVHVAFHAQNVKHRLAQRNAREATSDQQHATGEVEARPYHYDAAESLAINEHNSRGNSSFYGWEPQPVISSQAAATRDGDGEQHGATSESGSQESETHLEIDLDETIMGCKLSTTRLFYDSTVLSRQLDAILAPETTKYGFGGFAETAFSINENLMLARMNIEVRHEQVKTP